MSMGSQRFHKQWHRELQKGAGKKPGLYESIQLTILGRRDGRKGFPRLTEEDVWYSTFLDREVNSYGEFCSHLWGSLQIENADKFARLGQLADKICQKREELKKAEREYAAACQQGKDIPMIRFRGEDALSDAQVKARRTAEEEKRRQPLKNKVSGLRQELQEAEKAFSDLYNILVEDDNTVRMICHRVRDHILIRIDVYWNAALTIHPNSEEMPVVPLIELGNRAEEAYLLLHHELRMFAASVPGVKRNDEMEAA